MIKLQTAVQIMEYLDNCHLISCEGLPQKKKTTLRLLSSCTVPFDQNTILGLHLFQFYLLY